MSLYFQLRHMFGFATKNNICVSCAALWCCIHRITWHSSCLPKMQINVFKGVGVVQGEAQGRGANVFCRPPRALTLLGVMDAASAVA